MKLPSRLAPSRGVLLAFCLIAWACGGGSGSVALDAGGGTDADRTDAGTGASTKGGRGGAGGGRGGGNGGSNGASGGGNGGGASVGGGAAKGGGNANGGRAGMPGTGGMGGVAGKAGAAGGSGAGGAATGGLGGGGRPATGGTAAGGGGAIGGSGAGTGGVPINYVCGGAGGGGATGGTGAPSYVALGSTCSSSGTLSCASAAQPVLCAGGHWTAAGTCNGTSACDSELGVCAPALPACAGHPSGYSFCQDDTVATCNAALTAVAVTSCCGRCVDGACRAPRCGDGRMEAPELCDDGNATPADGCELDCTPSQIVQMAAGRTFTCVLLRSGAVRCWGGNDHGQLGLGHRQDVSNRQPYELGPIALDGRARTLAVGDNHACAILEDGSLACWGRNDFGQLGLGHSRDIGDDEKPGATQSRVPLGKGVRQVAAGGDTTCALLDDESTRCWGRNDFGQLGLGHTRSVGDDELPTAGNAEVALSGTATQLAVAGDHTCALLDSNEVRCWGDNRLGELGLGHTNNIGDDELPVAAPALSFALREPGPILRITAGGYHTCIQVNSTTMGSIDLCWGYDGDGSLGVGYVEPSVLMPADGWPTGAWAMPIDTIACGYEHTCVSLYDHDLRCFGLNGVAQLGLPSLSSLGAASPPINTPPIDFGKDSTGRSAYSVLFAVGAFHNCALLNTGEVHCWGLNADGQLGLGFKSSGASGFVGGDPSSTPGKTPAVKVITP